MKKEESRDEEENEDDGSTANAEEYDPMEAEDADDDEDDGTILFLIKWMIWNCVLLGIFSFHKDTKWF